MGQTIQEETNKDFYMEDGVTSSFLGRPGSPSPTAQTKGGLKLESIESTD